MVRLRCYFRKTEAMRYTGHLDVYHTWERLIRRAGLSLVYTQGYNPRPKINLSPALPLGFTSDCELIDLWLESMEDIGEVYKRLVNASPPGIQITFMKLIPKEMPPIQTQIRSAKYCITLEGHEEPEVIRSRISELLKAKHIVRKRRNKQYDLRPLIEDLDFDLRGNEPIIQVQLACREGATGRPDELLLALDYLPNLANIHRTDLISN